MAKAFYHPNFKKALEKDGWLFTHDPYDIRIGRISFVFTVVFHFDIKDGKIWLQRNITEYEIVDYLMENGVPKEDIVLGFRHPKVRPFTGFAVS